MTQSPIQYRPYSAFFEGQCTALADSPNAGSLAAVTADTFTSNATSGRDGEFYADADGTRQLVKVDTNYKATSRLGAYPVYLTRTDVVRLAAGLLQASRDTFDPLRCGLLRPAKAAKLLQQLQAVDGEIAQLREDALTDLTDLTSGTVDRDDLATDQDDQDDEDE